MKYQNKTSKKENRHLPFRQSAAESSIKEGQSLAPPDLKFKATKPSRGDMPAGLQEKMEYAFQSNFSDVKIHQNSKNAVNVGALAYTQGNDVHFAPGQYNPSSRSGQELIGHELSHVVQQRAGRVSATHKENGQAINDARYLETEADQHGKKAARGETVGASFSSKNTNNSTIQRKGVIQKLSLFSHGFLKDRDSLGYRGKSNRNHLWKDDQETSYDNDYNNYWEEFDDKFAERLGDSNQLYFDGSAGPLSSANDRMTYGKQAGKTVYESFLAKTLPSKYDEENDVIDEKVTLIGHSMGGAYAAGMAQELIDVNKKEGRKIFDIDTLYLVAPHQPADIKVPSGLRTVQYSHENDSVSSRSPEKTIGFGPFKKKYRAGVPEAAGSYLAEAQSDNLEYMVYDDPAWGTALDEEAGGHYVGTHDYIFDKYKEGEDGYVRKTH